MEIIRAEARSRLASIHNLSTRKRAVTPIDDGIGIVDDLLANYPWHRVTDGWKAQVV